MPIDASIPLGVKVPDQMQNLSSLLSAAKGAQEVQNSGISLQERQAMQQVLSNPENYTDEQGAFHLGKAQSAIMKAAPTTGAKYISEIAAAHQNSINATKALNSLTGENRVQIGSALASLPPDAPADLVRKTVDALNEQYGGRLSPLVSVFKQGYEQASKKGPQAASAYVVQSARGVLPQDTQQTMNTPTGVGIDNGQQSAIINVKPGVQGMAQGDVLPGTAVQKLLPVGQQDSAMTDAQGNVLIQGRDKFGNIIGTRPMQSAAPGTPGPFALPQGETRESMADLQQQRTAAQQAANSAPVMHDLNQTVIREVNKGLTTGSLGQLAQKLSSATGYTIGKDEATDYNLVGKMLERSALTAAQSMGPHTNAGLESSIRANGSLDYTPKAIQKIAHLNDALVSGAELYRDGLEKTITGSPNHVFAKREFDQKWSKVATPQVLRLKNAVDNGNPEEVSSVLKEVGGKGSEGAKKLHKQLTELLQLSGR